MAKDKGKEKEEDGKGKEKEEEEERKGIVKGEACVEEEVVISASGEQQEDKVQDLYQQQQEFLKQQQQQQQQEQDDLLLLQQLQQEEEAHDRGKEFFCPDCGVGYNVGFDQDPDVAFAHHLQRNCPRRPQQQRAPAHQPHRQKREEWGKFWPVQLKEACCLDGVKGCLWAGCCPCCIYGQNFAKFYADESVPQEPCVCVCTKWCWAAAVLIPFGYCSGGIASCLMPCLLRQQIRSRYNIQQYTCCTCDWCTCGAHNEDDLCTECCCFCGCSGNQIKYSLVRLMEEEEKEN